MTDKNSSNPEINPADKKIFSLNDLINMGLISREEIQSYVRYMEAKKIVDDMFKGMF